jgi:Short repeat of unknown function (DUF308)
VRIDSKGPKWPALYQLFSLYPNLATDYDYIWLPDDDLMASKADINRLFDICVAFFPFIAGIVANVFLGWLFLIAGIVGLLSTFRGRHAPGFGWP